MKKTYLIILGLLAILCNSCYSYKIYPKEYRKLKNNNPKPSVYIDNDTLKKELKILTSSNLFNIISDSTKADLKIKLYPLKKSFVCGQPLTVSMLTIGQLPVYLPDRYYYQFDEIENGKVTKRKFDLKITQRIWFWDLFAFNKKFEKKAGKAVLGEYYSNRK
ncbi:hypothetical protein [Tenacibaculum aiptasiae]|uniref:hypothetical protein n=1 Tax=Tenacibaculum aiptasiae TaxID=426481 RepID=UPI00232F41BC|nr:hypothetical protein [Tenacibaculum aiptasiae]